MIEGRQAGCAAARASDGRPAVYGIRPEHFQLNPEGLPAIVYVVEPTGSETQVIAEFAGASVLCAFRERVSARPGDGGRGARVAVQARLCPTVSLL